MCALANMNDTQNICSTETFKTSFPVFLRYRSAEIPTFLEGNQLLHSSCPCRKSNSVLPSDTISESCRDEFYIILHLHVSACGCVAVICLSCISSFTIKGAVSDTSSDSSKSTTAQHHDFITVTLDSRPMVGTACFMLQAVRSTCRCQLPWSSSSEWLLSSDGMTSCKLNTLVGAQAEYQKSYNSANVGNLFSLLSRTA